MTLVKGLMAMALLFSVNAIASEKQLTKDRIEEVLQQIELENNVVQLSRAKSVDSDLLPFLNFDDDRRRVRCPPHEEQSDCFTAVCDKLPSYACDDLSEVTEINQMCRGVDGDCVTNVCARLPSYSCDDVSEMRSITQTCRKVWSGDCLNAVCSRLPSYACDDLNEIEQAARACEGRVNPSCIESVCSRLPSYQCDDMSELEAIAKSCRGDS